MSEMPALILLLAVPLVSERPKVDKPSAAIADFSRRVDLYLKARKAAEAQIPGLKPTNSPEQIEQHEHSLADAIRQVRRDARHGDIFTPEITAEFRRLIENTMHGPQAARVRQSLRSGSPVPPRAISVNASYPPTEPLQSTPPSLLACLPPLPHGLDYRLIGRSLILRDAEANLILDFIPNVIS